jgi:pimeloyl-ACP methyl ester carboxylesterase
MGEIVLVHGAWHGPWCWDLTIKALESQGVVASAVELPLSGIYDDAHVVRAAVEAAGSGSVICGHSYGGVVVDLALEGVSEIAAVVYLAAFINDGKGAVGEMDIPLIGAIRFDGEWCSIDPERVHDLFYLDSGQAVTDTIAPRLRPMKLDAAAFTGEPPQRPKANSTYIVCTEDKAVPVQVQRRMAANCDEIVEMPTDHSPFLTRPDQLADLLASKLG